MSRNSVTIRAWPGSGRGLLTAGLAAALLVGAGCSADIARFESPLLGMNDSSSSTGSLGANAAQGGSLSDQSPASGGGYAPASRSGEVRMSALPESSRSYAGDVGARPPAPSSAPAFASPIAAPAQPAPWTPPPAPRAEAASSAASGTETVDVQPGDTLFGLARRHHVRVDEIKRLNNLTSSMIRPGQRLVLPAKGSGAATVSAARRVAAAPASTATARVEPPPSADAPGTYTMRPGDSLYSVARSQRVSLAELQRINGITDPGRIRVGTVLKLQSDASRPASAPPSVAVAPVAQPPSVAVEPEAQRPIASTTRPTIINGSQPAGAQVAAIEQRSTLTDAAPAVVPGLSAQPAGTDVASAAGAAVHAGPNLAFRWPAKGRVVSGFGPRPDGTHNDGIDIAVPLGTEVVAAESGVVAYAGSELKGFGNLILVRHEGGWVTAYAHNDELVVKRGDRVRRGQTIAKAGKTGNVTQPMVHFEIRQGSKPIDPMPHLEK